MPHKVWLPDEPNNFRIKARRRPKEEPRPSWITQALSASHFLPGAIVGFVVGLLLRGSPSRRFFAPKNGQREMPAAKGGKGKQAARQGNVGELSMVLVVRQDLKMGAGKIGAQCAHAATGIYTLLTANGMRSLLREYEAAGQRKVVLACKSLKEINDLRAAADKLGIPTHTVTDAGRTQVAAGSKTVLAIGPAPKSHVDQVTGHLRAL